MFNMKHKTVVIRCMLILVLFSIMYINLFQVKSEVYALVELPGTLDSYFDGDGLVTTPLGSYPSRAEAIAIQSDGTIVVSGFKSVNGYGDFALARYNEDGLLDTTFDIDGIVTTNFGSYTDDAVNDVLIQDDGKIVAVGYSHDWNTADTFALVRYNSNGSLDASFDEDGKVVTDIGTGNDSAFSAAIQSDGRIIAVGFTRSGSGNLDLAVVRYDSNGLLDTSFGTNGIVVTDISNDSSDIGWSVVIQSDGKIVVGGTMNGGFHSVLVRYNSNGSLDTSFAGDGIVTIDSYDLTVPDIALHNGKIILASHNGYERFFYLARFNSNGALDASFDSDGQVITSYNSDISFGSIAVQSNGKILVTGSVMQNTDYDFLVIRYKENGSLDTNFDTDGMLFTDFGTDQDEMASDIMVQPNGKLVVAGHHFNGSIDVFAVARYTGDEIARYVKWNATGANNGTSWTNAYTDLQAALAAASSGDEIWVAAGMYKPTTGSDRLASFVLKNDVAVYGGFAGTETLLTQRDSAIHVTTLSGDIGVADDNSDNSYHVVTGGGTNNTAVLDGFTIAKGNANDLFDPHAWGGGMHLLEGSPSLANLVFTSNTAKSGGGIALDNSNSVLFNVAFDDNSAESGGGMLVVAGTPMLTNVTFNGNTAEFHGGGIANSNSNLILENVTFYGNVANKGAGMYTYGSPVLKNVTFSGNIANNSGGGIYNESSSPIIINSILWNNSGGEIENYDENMPIVSHSIVQGGYPGTGNLDSDPLLGPLQDNGGPTETMALLAGSPAINAGDDLNCPDTDQRGVYRPQGSHCDIGAYEIVEPTFSDVPYSHPYWEDIEILYANGLTAGCTTSPLKFCLDQIMDRAQSAVFMLRGNFGVSYTPPTTLQHVFHDNWSLGAWAEKWAEGMYNEHLTAGCTLTGPLKFCPWDLTPREQAVIFGLKLKYGANYTPPPATGTVFADMTNPNYYATKWAEQAYADGLIPNCGIDSVSGKPKFCPQVLTTRGLAAYIIVRAKNLSMP